MRLAKNIPAAVESFIGRNHDVCMVLRQLKERRLITLTGEPGIGKTAVAKFIANYIKSRKGEFIKNGVMFLNVINCSSAQMLKHKFVNAFREGLGKSITKRPDKKDTEILFSEVMNVVSNLEFLLIIDDAEDLLRTSKNMLKEFIETLFEASSTIKVLITSKIEMISFLGGINGVKGGVIKLKSLSLNASERLLCEKAGRNISREEKNKLMQMEPVRVHGGVKNAYQHLFETILSGHPIAIGLAANIFSTSSLEFLYETLAKSSLMNTLSQGTIGKATINEKLRFSLKLTLRLVNDKDVILFFNLMGYFPGGTVADAISIIWPKVKKKTTSADWKPYYHFLSKASFITKKKVKVNNDRIEVYSLVPMLKTLAEESRSIQERKKVHKFVTAYFVETLEKIMGRNSTSAKVNEQLMNELWYHEMNVWDCIYRALEIKKHAHSINTGTTQLNMDDSPRQSNAKELTFDEEKSKIEEESGPLDDLDYETLLDSYKEADDEKKQVDEDKIINKCIDKLKENVLPKKERKELKDRDLLKILTKHHKSPSQMKTIGKKADLKPSKQAEGDDFLNMIQRNIDKKLKKTVNTKVVDMIKNNKELNAIDKPKEEIYRRIAHKIFEAQEEHKLYNGEATTTVTVKGKQVKQVSTDAKVLILYVSNLILFSKKSDAVKAIDEYGKYFYDKSLCEANLRKLRALALMDTKVDLKTNGEVVQEFLKAKLIFEQTESDHGQAIC